MAMYQTRAGNGELERTLDEEQRRTEQLVYQLAEQAAHQQRKVVEGLIALPAAIALRMASMTLRAVAFTARGFEVFQRAAYEAREQYRREDFRPERERAEGRQQEQPRA